MNHYLFCWELKRSQCFSCVFFSFSYSLEFATKWLLFTKLQVVGILMVLLTVCNTLLSIARLISVTYLITISKESFFFLSFQLGQKFQSRQSRSMQWTTAISWFAELNREKYKERQRSNNLYKRCTIMECRIEDPSFLFISVFVMFPFIKQKMTNKFPSFSVTATNFNI